MPEEGQKPPEDDTNKQGGISVGDIRKMVVDMVKDAVSSTGSKGGEDGKEAEKPASDVASQVQTALARIQEKEARAAREKSIDEQLAALAEKTKEKPPTERRKVHKLMGWGD